jgi:lipopolysaccharide biosynthesis glycosyltransferase
MIRIFIGYDRREAIGFQVLAHSIISRGSAPVSITPIALQNLGGLYRRDMDPLQSTEFSFSRFFTPYLAGYSGWAIFMDCDCICLDDIANLWALRDDRYALQCVQHDHRPTGATKFWGAAQTQYEKKNWSSVMLMNAARCTALTPNYVNTASGLDLHRFRWLENADEIGALPARWNHLVGYSEGALENQSLLHFTEGAPYMAGFGASKWADVWRQEAASIRDTSGNPRLR